MADSKGINQVQYDGQALDWATDPTWTNTILIWKDEYKDAKGLRKGLDKKYDNLAFLGGLAREYDLDTIVNAERWVDSLGLGNLIVSNKSAAENIAKAVAAYQADLRKAEDTYATSLSSIAKNHADTAAETARTAAETARTAARDAKTAAEAAKKSADNAELSSAAAQKSADAAAESARNAADAVTKLSGIQDSIQKEIDSTAPFDADNACQKKIDAAQEKVDAANTKLTGLKKEAQEKADELTNADFTKLLATINAAKAAVDKAKESLESIRKAVDTIGTYKTLSDGYASYVNDTEGDEPKAAVTAASESKGSVTIPESMYQSYLKAVLAGQENAVDGIDLNGGTVATETAALENTPATLPVLYWELDADGNPTGRYLTSAADLAYSTRYFVAQTLTGEENADKASFTLAGTYYTTGAAPVSPQPESSGEGSTSSAEEGSVVTIEENAVPLAGSVTADSDAPAVLGVSRLPEAAQDTPAVLGASRPKTETADTEDGAPAVLGANRSVATGDEADPAVHLAVFAASLAAAAVLLKARSRRNGRDVKPGC